MIYTNIFREVKYIPHFEDHTSEYYIYLSGQDYYLSLYSNALRLVVL